MIKQAQTLLPDSNLLLGDTSIENGKIRQVAPEIVPRDTNEIVDATELILLPRVIDPEVHFRELGLEHKEDLFTASLACAKGGVTSFLEEKPNTKPLTTTQAALDDKLQRAASKCLVNYGFFIGVTAENFPDLLEANPVCGIKIFMGSSHSALLVSIEEEIEAIFANSKLLIAVHAEEQTKINQRKQEHCKSSDR